VAEIEQPGFASCEKLTEMTVDENNAFYKTADGVLFTKDGKELVSALPGIIRCDIPYGTEIGRSGRVLRLRRSFRGNYPGYGKEDRNSRVQYLRIS